jgi:hypothetical protein
MTLHFDKDDENDVNCIELKTNTFLCYEKFDNNQLQLLIKNEDGDYYMIEIYDHNLFYDSIKFSDIIQFQSEPEFQKITLREEVIQINLFTKLEIYFNIKMLK